MKAKTTEISNIDGSIPVYPKTPGKPVYLYIPTQDYQDVCRDKDKFMIPYYRIKKDEAEKWLTRYLLTPPNPLCQYEGILLTVFDQDGAEPKYGAAIFAL